MSENKRLLLISMPFQLSHIPSIQLGTLCSYLKSNDIPVDVQHAYLRCADIFNPEWYMNFSLQIKEEIFYSYFLYPENFQRYRKKIKKYLFTITKQYSNLQPITLQTVLNRLRYFNKELLTKIDFSKYSLIGFTVTYDQLKPSVYLAGKIKQRYPDIRIVFGGAYCTEDLGISLLKTFPEIDFIVSGEGEEILTRLYQNLAKGRFDNIKGLGWRDNGSVKFNGPPEALSLDNLPIPEYDDYFYQLEECSLNMKSYIKGKLSIPIEGSRGCWWSKCTFCNLNRQYSRYREKSIERVIHEVDNQVRRYQCHSIRFVDNVQRIKNFSTLMSELRNLNMGLDIFIELRAGRLKKEDYRLMRKAGVTRAQIGVEAFGNKMLKKMNKGVTTIENIAAVKYCQEFGIVPLYNIIINYPNEAQCDLLEAIENEKFLKSFIPPFSVHNMGLYHKSPVYNNPKDFNIKKIKLHNDALWRFPQRIWQTLLPFFCDYTCITKREDRTSSWRKIFSDWQQTGEERMVKPLLFYHYANDFLTITDKLSGTTYKKILEGIERELYLFCDSIQNKSTIFEHFSHFSPNHIEKILEKWVANRWMFREEDKYLSLAVRLNPMISSTVHFGELKNWKPPAPTWKMNLKLGPIADINLSLNLKKKPAWLKRLKKIVTS